MNIFEEYFNIDNDISTIPLTKESQDLNKKLYLSIPKNVSNELVIISLYLQIGTAILLDCRYLPAAEARKIIKTYLEENIVIIKLNANLFLLQGDF